MTEKTMLILMIILAVMAVSEGKLRRSVIYLSIFSLAGSFIYLLYAAPDVAIAEAVIGSTLATILYLVAIKKFKVFTIYYAIRKNSGIEPEYKGNAKQYFSDMIERFCRDKELEQRIIFTEKEWDLPEKKLQYDILAIQGKNEVYIYGSTENYLLDELQGYCSCSLELTEQIEHMTCCEKFVFIRN